MDEQEGFIVTIKTSERVDFDRLGTRYNIDLFRHSAIFDEQKKQFIIDGFINLEQIGQLVRDGYIVEVKKYHVDRGLPASQIVNTSEWLKEAEKMVKKMEEAGKAEKGKAKRQKQSQRSFFTYDGGQTLPKFQYMPYEGFWQAFNLIHNALPQITTVFGIERTHEGRGAPGLKIHAGTRPNRRGVLFIGGMHARELVNPDILVSLAFDLLSVYKSFKTLRYGNKLFGNSLIKRIVNNFDIYIFPLANPDGRVHAQNVRSFWRMNRNPNGGHTCSICGLDGKGVDVNRNFDFLWNSGIHTSTDPCHCDQIYKGTSPFSEPDSRNIRSILDNSLIDSMVDVHSYRESVLYPWQIDENQTTDINMNFRNPAYDGRRGYRNDTYKEYIPQTDLNRYVALAKGVRDAINAVKGGQYKSEQGVMLYPASATSMDYAYSRKFVDPSKRKVMALALETGKAFNPIYPENGQPAPTDGKWGITKEISAGLIQFLSQRLTLWPI